jgi:NAD(P)-dependent dehydrogenase (short-subunit alcohol dehydrogenase family)
MADRPTLLVVGGTSGIGLEIASRAVQRGEQVYLTGRDSARTKLIADEVGATGLAVDLSRPAEVSEHLAAIEAVDHLVVAAIERDQNNCAEYDLAGAVYLATLKLVGYTEVVHTLLPRMTPDASIVLFGGLAKDRPYPGSTTVSTVNGGVMGMVHTLAVELAPIRVNAVHPGIVGDSPFWSGKPAAVLEGYRSRTPIGRLASMADVAGAVEFLLENRAVNGVNLNVDGGWLLL